jgi:hypothetical protein
MTADEPPALSIGAVLGDSDSESQVWKRAINALGKQVQAARSGVTSPLRLNVVFHLDGRLAPNEFTGVRTGRLDKKTNHLMVQAAVPGGPVDDRRELLLNLLGEAIAEAEQYARRKKLVDGQLTEIRQLVSRITDQS